MCLRSSEGKTNHFGRVSVLSPTTKQIEKNSENPFCPFWIQTQGKLPAIVHLAAVLKGKEVRALPRETALSLLGIHEGFRLQTFCCFPSGTLLISCMLLLPPWILCSSDASNAILNPAFPIIQTSFP